MRIPTTLFTALLIAALLAIGLAPPAPATTINADCVTLASIDSTTDLGTTAAYSPSVALLDTTNRRLRLAHLALDTATIRAVEAALFEVEYHTVVANRPSPAIVALMSVTPTDTAPAKKKASDVWEVNLLSATTCSAANCQPTLAHPLRM